MGGCPREIRRFPPRRGSRRFAAPDEYDPDAGDALAGRLRARSRRAWINGHDLGRYWNVARNDDVGTATHRCITSRGVVDRGDERHVLVELGGVANLRASFAVARMTQATKKEATEAAVATSGEPEIVSQRGVRARGYSQTPAKRS